MVTRTPREFDGLPRTQVQPETARAHEASVFTERRCRITVVTGQEAGKSVEIAKAVFTVGKDESSDLVLTDPTVSREHLVIESTEGAFLVRDLQSTNGTWIDHLRIREAYLRPGIVLRAGNVQLRFDPLFKRVEVAPSAAERFGSLVGRSVRMRQIFTLLERVAITEGTVVILGETGSGKSAVAKAIHDASPRRGGPLVTVDCGAIAENLIESELFGHEKGSFTGATAQRKGALERAQGGTLFIDELVDLRVDLQPRLLRALEEREIRRVGGNDPIKLDVRVIAASRHDLWQEVEQKRFREDLYFRLAVFTIPLPSLRDRKEDIPLLAESFTRSIPNGGELLAKLTPEVMAELSAHPFPGNVRELRNVIERAVLLGGDVREAMRPAPRMIDGITSPMPRAPITSPAATPFKDDATSPVALSVDDRAVPLAADCTVPFKDAKEALLEDFEREYLRRVIARGGGNASEIARVAGIDRKHLYTLAKKHGLDLKGRAE